MIDPDDFIALAIKLSNGPHEADLRSAVSRAYYGAFQISFLQPAARVRRSSRSSRTSSSTRLSSLSCSTRERVMKCRADRLPLGKSLPPHSGQESPRFCLTIAKAVCNFKSGLRTHGEAKLSRRKKLTCVGSGRMRQ